MAIEPDDSEYGRLTLTGPGWVHVNEDVLRDAADSFESLASDLRDEVIPAARKQMMQLSDSWRARVQRQR